jgi:hypothetical protein
LRALEWGRSLGGRKISVVENNLGDKSFLSKKNFWGGGRKKLLTGGNKLREKHFLVEK